MSRLTAGITNGRSGSIGRPSLIIGNRNFKKKKSFQESKSGSNEGSRPQSRENGSRPQSRENGSRAQSRENGSRPQSRENASRPRSASSNNRPASSNESTRSTLEPTIPRANRRRSTAMTEITNNLAAHLTRMSVKMEPGGILQQIDAYEQNEQEQKEKAAQEFELVTRFAASVFIEDVEKDLHKTRRPLSVSYQSIYEYLEKRDSLRENCFSLPFILIFWILFFRICYHHGYVQESFYLRKAFDDMYEGIPVLDVKYRRRLRELKNNSTRKLKQQWSTDNASSEYPEETQQSNFSTGNKTKEYDDAQWARFGPDIEENWDDIPKNGTGFSSYVQNSYFLSSLHGTELQDTLIENDRRQWNPGIVEDTQENDLYHQFDTGTEIHEETGEKDHRQLHQSFHKEGEPKSTGSIGWASLGNYKLYNKSIYRVQNRHDAFEWLQWGLLSHMWYGQDNGSKFIRTHNKIVGAVRIYQHRKKTVACGGTLEKFYNRRCHDEYAPSSDRFGPFRAGMAFSPDKKNRFKFFIEPGRDFAGMLELFDYLDRNRWVDDATSSLAAEMLLYNAELRMFSRSYVQFSFEPSGYVVLKKNTDHIKTKQYQSSTQMVIDGVWFILLVYTTWLEFVRLLDAHAEGYLREHLLHPWTMSEYLIILFGFVIVALLGAIVLPTDYLAYRITQLPQSVIPTWTHEDNILPGYLREVDSIIDEFGVMVQYKLDLKILAFVYTIILLFRFFKVAEGQPRLAIIEQTFVFAYKDVTHFLFIFFIVFCNFALGGYIIFGFEVADWFTVDRAVNSSFRALMGDFDFDPMYRVSPILAILWFWIYMILSFLILLNMFLAIIADTYMTVKKMTEIESIKIWDQLLQIYYDWQLAAEARKRGRDYFWERMKFEFKPPMEPRFEGVINSLSCEIKAHVGEVYEPIVEEYLTDEEKLLEWEKKSCSPELLEKRFGMSRRKARKLIFSIMEEERTRMQVLLSDAESLQDKFEASMIFLKNNVIDTHTTYRKDCKDLKMQLVKDYQKNRKDLVRSFRNVNAMNSELAYSEMELWDISRGEKKPGLLRPVKMGPNGNIEEIVHEVIPIIRNDPATWPQKWISKKRPKIPIKPTGKIPMKFIPKLDLTMEPNFRAVDLDLTAYKFYDKSTADFGGDRAPPPRWQVDV